MIPFDKGLKVNSLAKYTFIFLSISSLTRFFSYNLLEPMMTLIDILAVISFIYSAQSSFAKQKVLFSLLGILFVGLAFMTKGPVGLYPLIVPILFSLIVQQKKIIPSLIHLWVFFATLTISYFIYVYNQEIAHFFKSYYLVQVKTAIEGTRSNLEGKNSILHVTKKIFECCAPLLVLLFIGLKSKKVSRPNLRRWAYFFLAIGFLASFPISFSQKIRSFYFLPAMPFYILGGVSFYFALREEIKLPAVMIRILKTALPILATFNLIYIAFNYGKKNKEKEVLELTQYINSLGLNNREVFSTCDSITSHWMLIAQLQFKNRASLSRDRSLNNYYIGGSACGLEGQLPNYKLKKRVNQRYSLYKKI